MADLDKLMNLAGAVAAFEYGDGGKLVDSRITEDGPLDENMLDLLCHMCAANTCIATMQARGWENVTGSTGFYRYRDSPWSGLNGLLSPMRSTAW